MEIRLKGRGQEKLEASREPKAKAQPDRVSHHLRQHHSGKVGTHTSRDTVFHPRTTDINDPAIFNPTRTAGFTVKTSETAIKMMLGFFADRMAFDHRFNEANSAPWPFKFKTCGQIGRAGRIAETALNTAGEKILHLRSSWYLFFRLHLFTLMGRSLNISLKKKPRKDRRPSAPHRPNAHGPYPDASPVPTDFAMQSGHQTA